MKRLLLFTAFVGLIWASVQLTTWGRNLPTPGDEYTFETSRVGFQPITYPGPLTELDMVRLLLRTEGDFHLPLTAPFRQWRMVERPDLWELDLPQVLKVRLNAAGLEVVSKPKRLRLGVGAIYNLPVILRNELPNPTDIKIIATIGEAGPTDRWTAAAGESGEPKLTYASLNLRPATIGPARLDLRIYAGIDLPAEGSPPESQVRAEASVPADVVGWGTLRVTTVANFEPTPARVYVRGSDGLAYAPEEDVLSRITWTHGDYFYYSRGVHDIRVPEGRGTYEAVKGIRYRSQGRFRFGVRAGQTTEVDILVSSGPPFEDHWYGGDLHTHVNYNDHEFMTPEDIRLQVLGEDLNYANLMVANSSGAQIHDEQYFEGRPHRLSDSRHILYWGEEMRNGGVYGHMCLTGLKQLVKPLYTGFKDTSHPYDYPPNHVQALAAKQQGGVASYAHPGYRFTSHPKTMSAGELPVDLALGSVEAMDVMSNSNEDGSTPLWYGLLNTGLKCAISAGTDSFTNRRHHWIPGGHRVYVYTGDSLTARGWIENFRAGRSFATNGPMLKFTVNGKLAGTELALKKGDTVQIEASARSPLPMETLEIVMNGEVVATKEPSRDGLDVALSKEITVDEGAWVAARVRGPFSRYVVNDTYLYAHTSPVYLTVDGKKVGLKKDAQFFVEWIDQLIGMVEQRGRYASDDQKQEVITLFKKGRAYYEKVAAQ